MPEASNATSPIGSTTRVVNAARTRLGLGRILLTLTIAMTAAMGTLALVRAVEKLFAVGVNWDIAWIIASAFGIITGTITGWATRATPMQAARHVDEHANLRERLSTALEIGTPHNAWTQAAIDDANEAASRVDVRTVTPIRAPKWAWAPAAVALVVFVSGWLPGTNLLALAQGGEQEHVDQDELAKAEVEAQQIDDKLKEILDSVDAADAVGQDALTPDPPQAAPKSPEDVRQQTLKKLTLAQDALNDRAKQAGQSTLDEVRKRMLRLKRPSVGPQELTDLATALQQADFTQAQEALAELMNKMQSSAMSEEEKRQLAQGLQQMASQLNELAQQQDDLKNALAQAGMDPNLANSPPQLQQALQQAQQQAQQNNKPQLQQQLQQLQQQAQACQNAQSQCQNMGQCMSQAASAGSSSQGAGSLGQMSQQLSSLEAMQQELNQIMAAQNQLNQQMANAGMKPQLQSQGNGGGIGSTGTSSLKDPLANNHNASFEHLKANTKMNPNAVIISTQLIDAGQIKGQANAKLAQTVAASAEAAESAVEEQHVPREYHAAIKQYFGTLVQDTKQDTKQDTATQGTQAQQGETQDTADAAPDVTPDASADASTDTAK